MNRLIAAENRLSDLPKSVPEMRGIGCTPDARERERLRIAPYSVESYAAQYGITLEDAEAIRTSYTNHKDIVRAILKLFATDPGLKKQALMLEDGADLSPEEEEKYRRLLRHGIPDKAMERT